MRVASPAVAGARGVREGPRDSRKRQREDSIELEPAVRAHSLAGVFARAKVTEGSHRSMARAVKERHRLQFSKTQSKSRHEEIMRDGHMATLSAITTRTNQQATPAGGGDRAPMSYAGMLKDGGTSA